MKPETYPFVLRPLPYEYGALAPVIGMETLTYHHDKHYKTYVDNLNSALSDYPLLQEMSLQELLTHLEEMPAAIRQAIQNNGGGAYNHALYFDCMKPLEEKEVRNREEPTGTLAQAIADAFGSYRGFEEQMKREALSVFGSGWVWLVADRQGCLSIVQTKNQDVPDFQKFTPILLLDVWEHAYYLQYQNRRAEYVEGWFLLIHWRKAGRRYEKCMGSFLG